MNKGNTQFFGKTGRVFRKKIVEAERKFHCVLCIHSCSCVSKLVPHTDTHIGGDFLEFQITKPKKKHFPTFRISKPNKRFLRILDHKTREQTLPGII